MNDNRPIELGGMKRFDYRSFIDNLRPLSIIRMPSPDQIRFCSDIDLVDVCVDRGYTTNGLERISFKTGVFSSEIIAQKGETLDSEWREILKMVISELSVHDHHPAMETKVIAFGISALACILMMALGVTLYQDPPSFYTLQTVQDQSSPVVDTNKNGLTAALTAITASEDGN